MKIGYRYGIFLASVVILFLIFTSTVFQGSDNSFYIIVDPGQSRIEIDPYNTIINGWDSYSVTYFFLPAYINIDKLDYSKSEYKMFDEKGHLLETPILNEIIKVYVGKSNEESTPYRVAFYKSKELSSLEISMDCQVEDIEHESYSPAKIRLISQEGGYSFHLNQL